MILTKKVVYYFAIKLYVPSEMADDSQLESDAAMAASDFVEVMQDALVDHKGVKVLSAEMID